MRVHKDEKSFKDIYKMYLNDSNVKYICTIYDIIEESVSFYIRYSTDSLTIPEIEIDYDTLTDNPDNIYNEITSVTSNVYELMTDDDTVLSIHTFKGDKGPKCFVTFGEYLGSPYNNYSYEVIRYYNPINKKFFSIHSLESKYIKKKIEYKIKNITHYLIIWNINRSNNISKQKDEKVSKNQIGTEVCKVCLNNKVNILFLSCNHAICCIYCSEQLTDCPLCKAFITEKMYFFIN